MSSPAAPEPQSQKRTDSLLSRAGKLANFLRAFITAVTQGFYNTFSVAGTTVAAGAGITGTITATQVASGYFKVTAWFSGTAPAGNVTPIVSSGPHGGALAVRVAGEQDSTTQPKFSCVFIFAPGGLVGSQWDFTFTTTAGDQVLTLGHGVTGLGAGMLVEEYAVKPG